jgi:anhydro-N-acetylmuramic acid kinase
MVYRVIGLMSGSSMDGLDIAYCVLEETGGAWSYTIEHSACAPFPNYWQEKLLQLSTVSVAEFTNLHTQFGKWMGEQVNTFITENSLQHKVHIIASHGHTALHLPQQGTTVQIGCGGTLAATTGIQTVSDLRIIDVALGGNGAPIIPIAEKLLFNNYNWFLNLGGIANISYQATQATAFDVCPANRVLNTLCKPLNITYDAQGQNAAKGNINIELLNKLNALPYYNQAYPKSLANEIGTEIIVPLINTYNISAEDKLATMVEHIAIQITNSVKQVNTSNTASNMLITGGGAFNTFLINRLQVHLTPLQVNVVIPNTETINYKEALGMALIGALRYREEDNVLASVTGASRNSVGGALWLGNQ